MSLLGWIVLLLIVGGVTWLAFWGPVAFRMLAIALIVGLVVGIFVWEGLIDPGPLRVWPGSSEPANISLNRPPPASTTITVEDVPSSLDSDTGTEVGSSGGVTIYLYDDPDTSKLDLVVESPEPIEEASVAGQPFQSSENYQDGEGTGYWFFQVGSLSDGDTVQIR